MLLEREGILLRLRELASAAMLGRGRLALVFGEAGIGKTSVVSAFVDQLGLEARAFWGACDAVSPPRPFAAVIDIAARTGGPLKDALAQADRDRVFESFLGLIRHGPGRLRVIVLEDLHWADDATLDLLRVAGPRLRGSSALVIGTYRDHEVGPQHALRLAIGDMPADVVARIHVPPLSVDAVAQLSHHTLLDADALHAVTAGNPFFATEVIAASGVGIPSSIHDAVVARVERLSADAQDIVRGCAVLGPRCERDVLLTLAQRPPAALDECLMRGVLEENNTELSFRHELARRSVLDIIPVPDRIALHEAALRLLQARPDTDPARLARHAVEAQDIDAILEFCRAAGDRAAALEAHREAFAHYSSALRLADRLAPADHARLLEKHAQEASLLDDIDTARASQRMALTIWDELGNVVDRVDCLRGLSVIEYLGGNAQEALVLARRAVAMLEPRVPVGPEHARAYATLAQRLMVGGGADEETVPNAELAVRIAETFGDEKTAVHALTTLGVTNVYLNVEAGWQQIQDALARARAAGLSEDVTRGLINLVEAGLDQWRLDVADHYGPQATAWLEDRDMELYRRLNYTRLAELALRRGRWDETERICQMLLDRERSASVIHARALALMALVALRRGTTHATMLLDQAFELVEGSPTGQELLLLRTCRTEWALERGDGERALAEATQILTIIGPWSGDMAASEALFWAWRAGAIDVLPDHAVEPFRLHAEGKFLAAAEAWQEIDCPYYQALALAETSDTDSLLKALELLHRLGATPWAQKVTDRLRKLGASSLPRGPRAPTRRNPYGLTERELEVLALLGESLRNSDIAERLVLSPKTVDHHVTSVLRKLDVHDRAVAGAVARGMNLKDGVSAAQDREHPSVPRS